MNKRLSESRRSFLRYAVAPLALTVALGACAGPGALPTPLPLMESAAESPQATLVWVGAAAAFVWRDNRWQRVPSHDYEFSVTQRRYSERWESVKVQHRRHPGYDGSAGARDQVHYFRVNFVAEDATNGGVGGRLHSSLGDGLVTSDREFRRAALELTAVGVSLFAPYNRFRIDQEYRYESGELVETVELYAARAEGRQRFMKFEERAVLFAPHRFAGAPTRR